MAVLGLAIEAGLVPSSAELRDIHGISLLLTDRPVPEDTWLTAIGQCIPTSQPSELGLATPTGSGQETSLSPSRAESPGTTVGRPENLPHSPLVNPPHLPSQSPLVNPPRLPSHSLTVNPSHLPSHSPTIDPSRLSPPKDVINSQAPATTTGIPSIRFDEIPLEGGQSTGGREGESRERVESLPSVSPARERVEGSGGQADMTNQGSEERRMTGGKSIQVMQTKGLVGRQRVTLLLGPRWEGEEESVVEVRPSRNRERPQKRK
jgi:hypothetical protein